MKKMLVIITFAILIVSFLLGLYLQRLNKVNEEIAFEAEYMQLDNSNTIKDINNIAKEASNTEYVITPNTKIIEKLYYNQCNHLVQKERKTTQDLVNKNQSQFQIEYIGWEIQKFTSNEVVVYKEVNDFCNDHYLLKDVEGKINVYKLDKYDKEKELIKRTEIQTKYLPDVDIKKLKEGIKVNSSAELNELIQDYE